jgi:hypothetical protein
MTTFFGQEYARDPHRLEHVTVGFLQGREKTRYWLEGQIA